jgi:hypothetical protein
MRWVAGWIGLSMLTLSANAPAQPLPHVEYRAPEGCPDVAAFAARVRALAGAQPLPSANATYEARISGASAFTGELRVHEHDGPPTTIASLALRARRLPMRSRS